MARRKKTSFRTARRHGELFSRTFVRKLILWGIAVVGSLLLLGVLGYAQLLAYLQGEGFRDSMEKTISEKIQAESVELEGTFHIDGNRVSLPGFTMLRQGMLHGLGMEQLHAELKRPALLERQLHITRFTAAKAALLLDADNSEPAAPAAAAKGSGLLSRFAPTSVSVERIDCEDFNTSLHLKGKDYTLSRSNLSAKPMQNKQGWEFSLSGGRLHTELPVLGDCNLEGATISASDKALTLSRGRLILSPGELIIDAVQEKKSAEWSAELRINRIDVGRLLSADWKKRFTGELYGRINFNGNSKGLQQAEGDISVQQGLLEALPILSDLPLGNSKPYRHLRLERATAHISYPHADAGRNIRRAWLMDDIDIRAAGDMLRVKGHAMVDADNSLSGTLLIGLPEKVVSGLLPLGGELGGSLFNAKGAKGFLWLRLNLSGTLDDPQEDLSVRLLTLLGGKAMDSAGDMLGMFFSGKGSTTGSKAGANDDEEDFDDEEEEEEAAPPARRAIKNATDAAQDIIGSGLRSFF